MGVSMGIRKLILALITMAAVCPSWVIALGLGDIKLNSTLNQPLSAEIKLLETRDLSASEILIGLASREDFDRIGVDKPFFLTDLKFKVVLDAPDGPVIRVTSRKLVREPFLNFIVQAQWPSGKLLREYTLLLDLPVFGDQAVKPVQGAQTRQSAAPQTRQPRYESPPPRQSYDEPVFQPSQRQYSGADVYGPVKSNDTLWEIAAQVRPDRGVTMQQTMLAIQRLNPEAFINNNINLLRKGQVLRLPRRDEIAELAQAQAVSEVAEQNRQWSGDSNGRFVDADAQLSTTRSSSRSELGSSEYEGRLKLTSPEDVSNSQEGRGTGGGASSTQALENELALTLEELDKNKRENSDLKSRIEALEEQIKTMERLVEVNSEEARALQLAAEKNRTDTETAIDESSDTAAEEAISDPLAIAPPEINADDLNDALADITPPDTSEVIDEITGEVAPSDEFSPPGEDISQAESVEDKQASSAAAEKKVVDPSKVVIASKPKKAKKGLLDTVMDNILFVALGLVAVVLVVFLLFRSRNSDEEAFDEFMQNTELDSEPEDLELEDDNSDDIDTASLSALDDSDEQLELDQDADEDSASAEPETEDVVGEADIYIAYGKFEQAEEMLLKSLAKDAGQTDVRLKLLEVYANQEDLESFDPQYAKLLVFGDDNANERAEQLRGGIAAGVTFDASLYDTSDVEAFSSGGADGDSSVASGDVEITEELSDELDDLALDLDTEDLNSLDANLDFDLDTDLNLDENLAETSEEKDNEDLPFDSEELEDDFDLDLESDPDTVSETAEDDELEFDLDLDLDLDDDLEEEFESTDFDMDAEEGETEADEDLIEFDLGESDSDVMEDIEDDTVTLTDGLEALESDSDNDLDEIEFETDGEASEKLEDLPQLDDVLDAPSSEAAIGETQEMDQLNLDDGLDLQSLDQELDELTSGLDQQDNVIDDFDDDLIEKPRVNAPVEPRLGTVEDLETGVGQEQEEADSPEPIASAEPESNMEEPELNWGEEPEADTLGDLPPMDEPVIDFDGLDSADEGATTSGEKSENSTNEDIFEEAVANIAEPEEDFVLPTIDPEADPDDDSDLGFLSDSDETATKLDLARAYIDMGDAEGAKDILDEIVKEGNEQQKTEAEGLLEKI